MAHDFSPYVIERIGWYVYLLRDPRDESVFYVGKGRGNRAQQHAKDAIALAEDDKPKLATIRAVHAAGREVGVEILRHRLATEKSAYEVEAAVLDTFRAVGMELTNAVGGHHSALRGWAGADVVASIYDAAPASVIDEPLILVRLTKLWFPTMGEAELYEATSGWWSLAVHVGPRARYAAAVSRGVVRAVYRINHWRERVRGDRDWAHDRGKKPRLGFRGLPAEELARLVGTSVKHLLPQQGLRYLNCADPALPTVPILRGADAEAAALAENYRRTT